MIERLSNKVTSMVCTQVGDVSNEKKEIINYGMNLLIYELFIVSFIFVIAIVTGLLRNVLIMFVFYGLLHVTAGGAHARTRMVCFLTYTSSAFGIAVLANYLWAGSYYPSFLIFVLCYFVIIKYAPGDTHEKPILSTRIKKRLKIIALSVLTVAFIISIIAWYFDRTIYNVIVLSSLMAMFFLTPAGYKLLKCNRSCM